MALPSPQSIIDRAKAFTDAKIQQIQMLSAEKDKQMKNMPQQIYGPVQQQVGPVQAPSPSVPSVLPTQSPMIGPAPQYNNDGTMNEAFFPKSTIPSDGSLGKEFMGMFSDADKYVANNPNLLNKVSEVFPKTLVEVGKGFSAADQFITENANWLNEKFPSLEPFTVGPRVVASAIASPFKILGGAAQGALEGSPGKAATGFFAIPAFRTSGLIFNALTAAPVTGDAAKWIFGKLENFQNQVKGNEAAQNGFVKNIFAKPYQSARKSFTNLTGIPPEKLDDVFDFASNYAAFHYALKGIGAATDLTPEIIAKARDMIENKKFKVSNSEAWEAASEVTTGRKGNARPEIVEAMRDLFTKGGDIVSKAIKTGFEFKAPRADVQELFKKMGQKVAENWDYMKTPEGFSKDFKASKGFVKNPFGSEEQGMVPVAPEGSEAGIPASGDIQPESRGNQELPLPEATPENKPKVTDSLPLETYENIPNEVAKSITKDSFPKNEEEKKYLQENFPDEESFQKNLAQITKANGGTAPKSVEDLAYMHEYLKEADAFTKSEGGNGSQEIQEANAYIERQQLRTDEIRQRARQNTLELNNEREKTKAENRVLAEAKRTTERVKKNALSAAEGINSPTSPSQVKTAIRKNILLKSPSEKIVKSEDVLLRDRLRSEARGANAGFKAGHAEAREKIISELKRNATLTKDMKSSVINYANSVLPGDQRGKLLTAVRDAKTYKDGVLAFAKIDNLAEKIQLSSAIKDLKTKVRDFSENPHIATEYWNKIKDVVKHYDLQGRREKSIASIKRSQDYFLKQVEAGNEVTIPQRILSKMNTLFKIPKENLTIDKVEALSAEIDRLELLGKTKLKSRQEIYAAQKQNLKNELLEDIISVTPRELIDKKIGVPVQNTTKAINLYRRSINALQKTNLVLAPMDGVAKVTGMTKAKAILDSNFSDYLNHPLKTDIATERVDLLKKLKEEGYKNTKENRDRIGLYAAKVQEDGYEKLQNMGISKEEADAIELTPQEMEYYQFVRKTFDSQFPEVKRYMKEVYNKDVGQVKNYVSFLTDYEAMSDLEVFDRFGTLAEDAIRTKKVSEGFTKKRTGPGGQKIQLDIDKIFFRHTDDVAYMLTMGRDIKALSEIVNSSDMSEAMGETSNLAWKQYLNIMARKGGADGAKRLVLIDWLRKNLGASVLPFKLSSVLVQVTSFADAANDLGADYVFKGAVSMATSKTWRKFIKDNFPEVRDSIGDDPGYAELSESVFGPTAEVGMKALKFMDGMVRATTAAGAYQKLMDANGLEIDLKNPNKEMVNAAQKLVRKSQGSSFYKDQPIALTTDYGITGNRSMNKALFQFQSFVLSRWDNIKDSIWREGFKKKNFGKAFSGIFWLILVAGALETGIRKESTKLINAAVGYEPDDTTDSPLWEQALGTFGSSIPIFGSIMNAAVYGNNPVPIINTGQQVFDGIKAFGQAKKTSAKALALTQATGAVANIFFGIPGATQVTELARKFIQGLEVPSLGLSGKGSKAAKGYIKYKNMSDKQKEELKKTLSTSSLKELDLWDLADQYRGKLWNINEDDLDSEDTDQLRGLKYRAHSMELAEKGDTLAHEFKGYIDSHAEEEAKQMGVTKSQAILLLLRDNYEKKKLYMADIEEFSGLMGIDNDEKLQQLKNMMTMNDDEFIDTIKN